MNILSSPIWPSDMTDDRRLIALLGLVQISEDGMYKVDSVKWEANFGSKAQYDKFVAQLTADKDVEIERLRFDYEVLVRDSENCKGHADFLRSEVERLNALVAMQADLLKRASKSIGAFCGDEGWTQSDMNTLDSVDAAIAATAETVSAWQSKHDAEIRAKALEDAADWLDRHMQYCGAAPVLLINIASELRAKGE